MFGLGITAILGGLAAIASAVLGAWGLGKRSGRVAAQSEITKEDTDNARRIEERADAARVANDVVAAAGGPAVDRLHKAGRLRD